MNTINLIIRREYLTRVRKKSFIIMSVLGPLIFAAYILIPMYFATLEDREEKLMVVIDDSGLFTAQGPDGPVFTIQETETIKFQVVKGVPIETFKETFEESGYYGLLFIPANILASNSSLIYSTKQTSIEISEYLKRSMESEIEDLKLAQHEIEDIDKILDKISRSGYESLSSEEKELLFKDSNKR